MPVMWVTSPPIPLNNGGSMRKNNEELTAKQGSAVEYMLRPECDRGALLAFDMGLGKTRTGLMFAREYGAKIVLIVIPLQTMEDWVTTAREQYPDIPVKIINSTLPGKKAMNDFIWRAEGIYLVTHQYWEQKAWDKVLVTKRRKTDPDKFRKVDSGVWGGSGFLFIFDEVHRAANCDNWTNKALMNLDPRVFKLGMSGTPFGGSFDGAYGVTKWIWPHRIDIIPANIFDWRALWAETKYDPFAPRNEKTVGEKVEGAFVSALPAYIREESAIPPAFRHTVTVNLYPEQRRVYTELDNRMVAWINENPLVAEYSITKRIRQRQTTLAFPSLHFNDDGELTSVDFDEDALSVKIDALFAEIEGRGTLGDLMVNERLLILTDSQKFARILTARMNKQYGDVAREWSGKVTRVQRKKVKAAFISGEIQHIVGVQAAMGTGTDGLQYTDARIVVFMSRADRRIDNQQGTARLNREGQTQQVHEVSFIAEDTVDTGQLSNQLEAAIKMAKSLRAEERRRIRDEQNQRNGEQNRPTGGRGITIF